MKAAVTGANGFVGKYLTRMLLEKGFSVKVLVRSSQSLEELNSFLNYTNPVELTVVTGDISEKTAIAQLVADVDLVFHTAAMVSFKKKDRNKMIRTNIDGTRVVVDTMLEINPKAKLIHFSSIATLQNRNASGIINENSFDKPPANSNLYSVTKFFAELEVWRGINEGLHANILNPAVILGYDANNRSSSNILNFFSKKIPFVPQGKTGFVDVLDVCRASLELAQSPITSERFVLCAENLSYADLYQKIQQIRNTRHKIRRINPKILIAVAFFSELISLIPGIDIPLTKEMAGSSSKENCYNGKKIEQNLNFHYTSIDETLRNHLNIKP